MDSQTILATAAILAGGKSSRMGSNKALLPIDGIPLIQKEFELLKPIFSEVIIITNSPEDYSFINCIKFPDILKEKGAAAGVHSALLHGSFDNLFITACDMPNLNDRMIRFIAEKHFSSNSTVTIPQSRSGLEPLVSFYSKKAYDCFDKSISSGEIKIIDIIKNLCCKIVTYNELSNVIDSDESFLNINRPDEYRKIITKTDMGGTDR